MSVYLWPIKMAFIFFPIISFFLAIPYMIFEYYKYGSVSKKRTLIIYSLILYLLSVYFLVILPLPDPESVTNTYRDMMQLKPFKFVSDFLKHTSLKISEPGTYKAALFQGVFTQPVFNIIMTIPFGMYMRYYFKKSKKEVVLYSFLLSLFFEISQLSGLFGIYPGPYRLFDVDDLMLNTFGGYLGFYCAPFIEFFFPSRDELDVEAYRASQNVGYIRRYLSLLMDLFLIRILLALVLLIFSVKNQVVINIIEISIYIIYFVFFVYYNHGQSIMQKILHLKIVSTEDKLTKKQLFIRTSFIYIFIVKFNILSQSFFDFIINLENQSLAPFLLYLIIIGAYYLIFLAHIIYTVVKNKKIIYYDRISKTRVISNFDKNV